MSSSLVIDYPQMFIAGTDAGLSSSLKNVPIGGGEVNGQRYVALFKNYEELDRFCDEKGNMSKSLTIGRANNPGELRQILSAFNADGCGFVSFNAGGEDPGNLISIDDVLAAIGPATGSSG